MSQYCLKLYIILNIKVEYVQQAKIRVSICTCIFLSFFIYLTHDEDHKVIYYAIYYASLTHACYIVLFCHGLTRVQMALP